MKAYVYVIRNKASGKEYVGKTTDLDRRWRAHKTGDDARGGVLLKRAIKKHGVDNFEFNVLAECESEQEAYDIERKMVQERQTLSPNGYNLSSGGRGCFRPSVETRQKMSEGQQRRYAKQEEHDKLSRARLGVPKTEEHKRNMRKPKSPLHAEKLRKHLRQLRNQKV